MSSPRIFPIKEEQSEIKYLIKKNNSMIAKRLQVLLVFKQNESTGISKRIVADKTGVDHNSVQTWRTTYIKGGISALINHKNIGYKPSIITLEQEKELSKQLLNPKNGFVGFVELLEWFNKEFNTDVCYKTFHGFVVRKFKAKIKVARKSHIKKDDEAVETFKKTSINSATTSTNQNQKDTKL